MSLTAAPPDREVTDGLLLDAAWQRVKDVERERDGARRMARVNRKSFEAAADRRYKLANGIAVILMEGESGKTVAGIMADLSKLLREQFEE